MSKAFKKIQIHYVPGMPFIHVLTDTLRVLQFSETDFPLNKP